MDSLTFKNDWKSNWSYEEVKKIFLNLWMFRSSREYSTYLRSHVESSLQAWSPHFLGDIDKLEKI